MTIAIGKDPILKPVTSNLITDNVQPSFKLTQNNSPSWTPKEVIAYTANGSSSIINLLTFILGNFNPGNIFQEVFEKLSDAVSKLALTITGFVGTKDLWDKKNILPFFGYVTLIPITLLSTNYNTWVARGFSYGLCNFAVIIDRRNVLDKNGNIIASGNFKKRGWKESFTIGLNESYKMILELFQKPSNIKNFTHATLITSLFQMVGFVPGLFGFKQTEATIRDISAVLGDLAMLLDDKKINKKENQNKIKIDLKSPIVQSAILWIGTSVVDLFKRFNFIADRINNLTELASFFDRTASIRFTQGVLDIK